MIKKRGQVAIFIVIAIVVATIVLAVFFSKSATNVPSELKSSSEEVNLIVGSCLEDSLRGAIILNSLNGGYYNLNGTAYYLDRGVPKYPSKQELGDQLNLGIKEFLSACLNFSEVSADVEYSLADSEITTILSKDKALIEFDGLFTISSGSSSATMNNFKSEIKTDYLEFYNIALNLTQEQEKHSDEICLTCIGDVSNDKKVSIVDIEKVTANDYTLLYTLSREDSGDKDNLLFVFAHRFNLSAETGGQKT